MIKNVANTDKGDRSVMQYDAVLDNTIRYNIISCKQWNAKT